MLRKTILSLLVAAGSVSTAMADKNAALETKLASVGSPVISEPFNSPLAAPFVTAKGEWEVKEGTLSGKELAADKHAAVLNFQKPNRNSVVRLSFKTAGSTEGFHLSLNHAKGHLFRVVVTPTSISINLDKDKKDPASKAVVLATAKGSFTPGEWYTMQVEMVGDRVAAQTDNGLSVEASHAKLDTEKPNYRLVMRGESLFIDDLQIWDVK